jgi:hypothetical protein
MHAIPLARAGARVLAIDSSEKLLAGLVRHAAGLAVKTVCDDLLSFRTHLAGKAASLETIGFETRVSQGARGLVCVVGKVG